MLDQWCMAIDNIGGGGHIYIVVFKDYETIGFQKKFINN